MIFTYIFKTLKMLVIGGLSAGVKAMHNTTVHARDASSNDSKTPGQLPYPTIVVVICSVVLGVFAGAVAVLLWWFTPWRTDYHEDRKAARAARAALVHVEEGRAGLTRDREAHRQAFIALGMSDGLDEAGDPNAVPLTEFQLPSLELPDVAFPPQAHMFASLHRDDASTLQEEHQ